MPGSADQTAQAEIVVDGSPLPAGAFEQLTVLRVRKSRGRSAVCELRLRQGLDHDATFKLGDEVKVSVISETSESEEIFIGDVASLEIDVAVTGEDLVVTAYDKGFALGRATVAKTYLSMTASDIASDIASRNGLTPDVGALGAQMYDVFNQAGTDYQLLDELCEAANFQWFVDGAKLVVAQRETSAAVVITAGEDLRDFRMRCSAAQQPAKVTVRTWDSKTKEVSSGEATSYTTASEAAAATDTLVKAETKHGDALVFGVNLADGNAATKRAKAINDTFRDSLFTGRGEVDVNAAIKPGALIEVKELGDRWSRKYFVTDVDHVMGGSQPFVTRFALGESGPSSLVDLLGTSPNTSADRLSAGLTPALVTANDDPDGLGRVKVSLKVIGDTHESDWARVVQQGAGLKRGWMILPEIDDEVMVGFENGDLNRPIVLGGVANSVDEPPTDLAAPVSDAVATRSFTSRTGHLLLFSEEGADGNGIMIKHCDEMPMLNLDKEKVELLGNDQPITIENGTSKITVNKDGIEIKADKITLKSTQAIKIDAGSTLDAKATSKLTLDGAQVAVKAKSGFEADGGAKADIKGGMVNIN
ncbi:VgrG-related protein [Ilumatobacter sp.]|nr:VgrG-related protein [Ilumatobacter sp.]